MKKFTESFLANAHFCIMAITLACVYALSTTPFVKHAENTLDGADASFASYGYIPEYAVDGSQQALNSGKLLNHQSDVTHSDYLQKSIQYTVGVELQAFDPEDVQQNLINVGRDGSAKLTPVS